MALATCVLVGQGGRYLAAELEALSRRGARLRAPGPLRVGDRVELLLSPRLILTANVVESDARAVHVTFQLRSTEEERRLASALFFQELSP